MLATQFLELELKKSRGVLWSIHKVVAIMNVMIKVQDGKYTLNVAPKNCIVIGENDIPENWQDEY